MSIKQWALEDQPREKLLAHGPEALSDAQLLAVFFRTGTRGKSAVDLGEELIARYGGIRGLMAADGELRDISGLGTVKYIQLRAVLEMAKRYLTESLARGQPLTSPEQTRNYLLLQLRDRPHEVFACLFLDNKHRVIGFEEMFRGTIDCASVYPREILKRALELNAAALVLAHNHPSGDPEPSPADNAFTRRINSALELVDIRLLDHFVVGGGECVSFAERGLI
jgi:DNA repair protein RadC